jgi:hypothetical protein
VIARIEPRAAQCVAKAAQPRFRGPLAGVTGQVGDVPVSEVEQRLGGVAPSARLIGQDRRNGVVRGEAVQQNGRNPAGSFWKYHRPGTDRGEDHGIGLPVEQVADQSFGLPVRAAGVDQEQQVSLTHADFVRSLDRSGGELAEVDVVADVADSRAASLAQPLRGQVRAVVEFGDRLQDPSPSLVADRLPSRPVENERDGRGRDAGQACDIGPARSAHRRSAILIG